MSYDRALIAEVLAHGDVEQESIWNGHLLMLQFILTFKPTERSTVGSSKHYFLSEHTFWPRRNLLEECMDQGFLVHSFLLPLFYLLVLLPSL